MGKGGFTIYEGGCTIDPHSMRRSKAILVISNWSLGNYELVISQ